MNSEWYEIAWINFNKGILHGRGADDQDIEQVLTEEQREEVYALSEKHDAAMKALLKSFVACRVFR